MPALQRLPDWPSRLAAYLQAQRATAFAWGTADCVRFAAGAVHAITGHQVLPVQWASVADAARLLRHYRGLASAVGSVLPELAGPQHAQRGDVLLVRATHGHGQRQWLAVADADCWWVPSASGLACGSMAHAVRAWGVGHG